ncbi:cell division protein SepF [Enterococcus sp. 669A]|uniref:Cell division protein SepF n=1 Tax=Candidatus Enterococcus moelleringii TaxID=2815325 RepID=A0ABS3LF52_9ENTE|nr:cell division protein SepF [Enterococcus sp. 669A]MBO1308267.1 cell division protein SepF [Enterococcus sp. 669A]
MAINLEKISDFFGLADEDEVYEEPVVTRQPVVKQPKREKRAQKKPMVNKSQQPTRKEPVKRTTESVPAAVKQPAKVRQPEKSVITKPANAVPSAKRTEKVINMPNNEAMQRRAATQAAATAKTRKRISVVEPKAYNEAMVIAKRIAQGEAVLINFQSLDDGRARRIVDFLTGAVFMIDGDIKRAGNEMFLCIPANMEIDNSTLQSMGDQDIFGLEL